MNGMLIADPMGMGKTLMVLVFIAMLKVQSKLHGPAVILVASGCGDQWMAEIAKFIKRVSALWHAGMHLIMLIHIK